MREFRAGMLVAGRRWPVIGLLSAMMAVTSAVLTFLMADVMIQYSSLRGGLALREHNATILAFHYSPGIASTDSEAIDIAEQWMSEGKAYTAVVSNVRVNDPGFAGGHPVAIVIGQRARSIFPDLELCSPAPCAMRGERVEGPVPEIEIADHRLTADEALPRGAVWFDPHASGHSLDETVVLHLRPEDLPKLNSEEQEEALINVVSFGIPEADMAGFVRASARTGLYLIPSSVQYAQSQQLGDVMTMSAVYVLGIAAFAALTLMCFAMVTRQTLRARYRDFAIRRMYGARESTVWLRVAGFLATVVLALPVPILVVLMLMGYPVATPARWILAALVALFAAFLVRGVMTVRSFDRRETPW
ncbi:MAG: hypothetical protein Q3979_06155 [Actinomycetaceae bacterium]|nr:hypothetical protein [Actinomycetaceae bacterium]